MQHNTSDSDPARLRRLCLQALALGPWCAVTPTWARTPPAAVQLASDWPAGRSPQGYLISEKLDGVRAVWDGERLRFRSGREIAAPAWWTRALPQHPLDGELWLGRGQFDVLSGTVRQQQPNEAAWRALQYSVFDAPGLAGPFAARVQAVQTVVTQAGLSWLSVIEQSRLEAPAQLQQRLEEVTQAGGEGLMLHRADALWRSGRSDALFKLKPEPDDEAQVLRHEPGQGRLAGLTGALRVRTADGLEFSLGSGLTDALRRDPPAVGSWVTYRYRDRTPSGLPRFATFVRVRAPE